MLPVVSVAQQVSPVIHLDLKGDWRYANVSDTDGGPWYKYNQPSRFTEEGEFSFRKRFALPAGERERLQWVLDAESVGGRAFVLINGKLLHANGEIVEIGDNVPVKVPLPVSYLKDGTNTIEILLDTRVNAHGSIPARPVGLEPEPLFGLRGHIVIDGVDVAPSQATAMRSVSLVGEHLLSGDVQLKLKGTLLTGEFYGRMAADLSQFKQAGGNAVRFISFPEDRTLTLCDSLGLFALVDLPIGNQSSETFDDAGFQSRVVSLSKRMIVTYGSHPCVIGFGINSLSQPSDGYTRLVKQVSTVFASAGVPIVYEVLLDPLRRSVAGVTTLSLLGLNDGHEASNAIRRQSGEFLVIGAGSLATLGDHSGSSNEESLEGQAKLLIDEYVSAQSALGFFGGSLVDYVAATANSLAGNPDHYLVTTGLLDSLGRPRPALESLGQAFRDEHITPLQAGESRSDAPLLFLIYGFVLVLLFFLLMNVDRRFREYVSRALLRPFNFFADVRDQRLVPNVDTIILAVIISGSLALLFGTLLHNYREGVDANWCLALVCSRGVHGWLSTLSWDYTSMIIWFTLLVFAAMVLIGIALRFAAIFVRGRIFLNDTFNVVVWALLPYVFLLPLDLILPRMDRDAATVSLALISFLVLTVWVIYRLLKGTGVLFDVYPTRLYFYGSITILVLIGVTVLLMDRSTNLFENYSLMRTVLRNTELTP